MLVLTTTNGLCDHASKEPREIIKRIDRHLSTISQRIKFKRLIGGVSSTALGVGVGIVGAMMYLDANNDFERMIGGVLGIGGITFTAIGIPYLVIRRKPELSYEQFSGMPEKTAEDISEKAEEGIYLFESVVDWGRSNRFLNVVMLCLGGAAQLASDDASIGLIYLGAGFYFLIVPSIAEREWAKFEILLDG